MSLITDTDGPWAKWAAHVLIEIKAISEKLQIIESTVNMHQVDLKEFDTVSERISHLKEMIDNIKVSITDKLDADKVLIEQKLSVIRSDIVDLEANEVNKLKTQVKELLIFKTQIKTALAVTWFIFSLSLTLLSQFGGE